MGWILRGKGEGMLAVYYLDCIFQVLSREHKGCHRKKSSVVRCAEESQNQSLPVWHKLSVCFWEGCVEYASGGPALNEDTSSWLLHYRLWGKVCVRNSEVPCYLDNGGSEVWWATFFFVKIKLCLFWNLKPVRNMCIKKMNAVLCRLNMVGLDFIC